MGRTRKHHEAARSAALAGPLYQTLETELRGMHVYAQALKLAVDVKLREEWAEYLAQTEGHVAITRTLLETAGLDPEADVPSRRPARTLGRALVGAMAAAQGTPDGEAAQLTAAQCVVLAETADHAAWEMIGLLARDLDGDLGRALREAQHAIQVEGDQHLEQTVRWMRRATG